MASQIPATIGSWLRACCRHRSARTLQAASGSDIARERLIFPGVGAFGQAMDILRQRSYTQALKEYVLVRARGWVGGGGGRPRARYQRTAPPAPLPPLAWHAQAARRQRVAPR